ncbi:unnamed protein product [Paramecium sonneborni]|uniref:Ubiquitin-like domain-containing protein n=1 Tax=Paramecium sonneborni TaxID=65129 RepID=A0A8S1QUR2_9CILI|nr:unnamed protein product [Paramecium sonneborni]
MLKVKYSCGLREVQTEAQFTQGNNKLRDLRRIICQDIRVKPHLISISNNNEVITDDNELLKDDEFYFAYVMPDLKQYNFQIKSRGGQFFECTLEELDLFQDLIEQIDQFLAQIIKQNFDSYELYIQNPDQSKNLIPIQSQKVIRDIFKETNIIIEIQLIHNILSLTLLEDDKIIKIHRNKTLLDLKEQIGQNEQNLAVVINGKYPPQNFDNRLIKDVLQHEDTIFIVQVNT